MPTGQNAALQLFIVGGPLGAYRPVSGEYGGPGTLADYVFWHEAPGNWYVRYNGTGGFAGPTQWGLAGDTPLGGDYTGDGFADFTTWRNNAAVDYATFFYKPSNVAFVCPYS